MAGNNVSVDEAVLESATERVAGDRNTPEMLEWLKDAGLGLFIHWSVDVQLGCVISHSLVGASRDYCERYYSELPRTFDPVDWDPERVARLARISGAQYAVFTTKHHNGFCMWDTATTPFNVMNTPYGRDIVRGYVDAFRRQGLKVGFYYSPEDFRFLYDNGLTITRTPVEPYSPEVMRRYREYLTAQMTELMTGYGPIDLIFFDGGELMRDESGESLQELCRRLAWDMQPGILVTRGAIKTPEQQLPGVGMSETWEACITMSSAWGYQPTNEIYKTGAHLIDILMTTRSLGGTLLLNIGPDANGAICAQQEGLLRELGLWNFINRDALLGVRPWILAREGDLILLTDKAGDTLYAVVTGQKDWSRGERREFVIRSARATGLSRADVLGASGELTEYRPDIDAASYIEQRADGLHVSVLKAQRIYCGLQWPNPPVIRITHVERAFVPMEVHTGEDALEQGDGVVTLRADVRSLGSFERARAYFEWRRYPGFAMASYDEGWQETAGVDVAQPGRVSEELRGLERGVTYQYRAVIANDMNRMQGENALFVVE